MPVYYRLDPARRFIRTSCSGEVRLPEVLRHFDELERHPARPSPLNVLLDLTGLETPPQADQLQAVRDRIGGLRRLAFGACAIVGDRDAVIDAASRFGSLVEPFFRSVAVFRSRSEAEAWLAPALASSDQAGP